MRKTRLICFVLVLSILCGVLSGCAGDKRAVEQRVQDFVLKCNQFDLEGMLRCVDPALAEPIFFAITVLQLDKYEILEMLYDAIITEDRLNAASFFTSIGADIVRTKVRGKNAEVYANVSYSLSDFPITKEAIISLSKVSGVWYIMGISFEQFD